MIQLLSWLAFTDAAVTRTHVTARRNSAAAWAERKAMAAPIVLSLPEPTLGGRFGCWSSESRRLDDARSDVASVRNSDF